MTASTLHVYSGHLSRQAAEARLQRQFGKKTAFGFTLKLAAIEARSWRTGATYAVAEWVFFDERGALAGKLRGRRDGKVSLVSLYHAGDRLPVILGYIEDGRVEINGLLIEVE